MKKLLALLIAFLLCFSAFSLAEEYVHPSPAELELNGIVDAFFRTRNLPEPLNRWEDCNWYEGWKEMYSLTGDYHFSFEFAEAEEESAVCDVALAAWQKACGITAENDFSLASEAYLIDHIKEDGSLQSLWLVIRVHDESMPHFFVLVDRDTQQVIAHSDVENYLSALEQRILEKEEFLAKEKQVLDEAKKMLLSFYGNKGGLNIKADTLESYFYTAIFLEDAPGNQWIVWAYAPEDQVPRLPDFTLKMDFTTGVIYQLLLDTARQEQFAESLRWEKAQSLLDELGDWGQWTIEEKAQYGELYNGNTYYGVPSAEDLPYEEALKKAKEALIAAYPDQVTEEKLNAALLCPFFYTGAVTLYDTDYTTPVYYFAFTPDTEKDYECYEVILDGRTGEIYLTHDPASAGNG